MDVVLCDYRPKSAGSERVGRSEATGERLEEAKHINRSLAALGDVMAALAAKQAHVPFRNSKLTQLLQDSLAGQAKAMMFIHIAPEVWHCAWLLGLHSSAEQLFTAAEPGPCSWFHPVQASSGSRCSRGCIRFCSQTRALI